MKEIILVVDDDSANLMLAQKILGKEFRIAAATSGVAALKYLERNKPDLILLDINMPEVDGFEVLEKLRRRKEYKAIPVIFLTADKSTETETKCFQAGAQDFVGKPFVPDILISRVRRILELERYHNRLEELVREQSELLLQRTERISQIQDHVIVGMANLIESRDGSTGKHVKNTQHYVQLIVDELHNRGLFDEILTDEYMQNACKAAPLHDIGKIKIPDHILQKPGKLTEEEFDFMKKHTTYSGEIINDIIGDVEDEQYVKIAGDIAMYHHERWDGKGYPTGISGDEIPLCARIMSVADVFDALCEERCYKPAIRPLEKVFGILQEGKGTQFDPTIVQVFCEMEPLLRQILGEEQDDASAAENKEVQGEAESTEV